ncbi:MAG: RidA family protein [Gemmatimonadales bacterium]|nr:RidA family protein [Gemmatimonadales bacterium]
MTNPDDLPEARLLRSGLTLPTIGASPGNFLPFTRTGRLLYVSGQIPIGPDGPITGQVGSTVSESAARESARLAALRVVAVIRLALGSLDRVARIVKVNGYVNGVAGFGGQPAVIDGCSELLVEIFGERGRHARAAIGAAGLPFNVPVEVEVIVEAVDEW